MGAGQTYQWAVSHPEMVAADAAVLRVAADRPHNKVFLEGVKAALTRRRRVRGGLVRHEPADAGCARAARVYAGWGFSQAFYWDEVWRELGYTSLEDFLVGFWEGFFLDGRDANNLLAMLWTWQHGDVGRTPGFDGDTEAALALDPGPGIVMPAEKDLYFPPEDEEWAVAHIPNAELRVIPGVWGHFAGGGANPVDTASSTRRSRSCSPPRSEPTPRRTHGDLPVPLPAGRAHRDRPAARDRPAGAGLPHLRGPGRPGLLGAPAVVRGRGLRALLDRTERSRDAPEVVSRLPPSRRTTPVAAGPGVRRLPRP